MTAALTSATGVLVYRGNALSGCDGDLFVADVASNLVHRKRLLLEGAAHRAHRMGTGREFLASPDLWFRPAQIIAEDEKAVPLQLNFSSGNISP